MRVSYVCEPDPGRLPCEDHLVAGPGFVAVLDGATPRPGLDSGCSHGVAWLVRRLGGALAARLAREDAAPLADLLAAAIGEVRAAHGGGCDLTNPDSPSATAAIVRWGGADLDWLVLADSPVVVDQGAGEPLVIRDDRVDLLPSRTAEAVRRARNRPGGFWVASTSPDAAHAALTGSVPAASVRRAAVLTDGAARLVERFGLLGWGGLLDVLETEGPAGLVRRTRVAEAAETEAQRAVRIGKHHDDATAVLLVSDPAEVLRPPRPAAV